MARAHVLHGVLELLHVHVALEGLVGLDVEELEGGEVAGLGALGLYVGAGGVEVHVVDDYGPWLADAREEHILGGPPLVGGHEVLEAEHVTD